MASSTLKMPVDSAEALPTALERLRAEELVGVAMDSVYHIAASGLSPPAIERLRALAPDDRLTLALAFPVEVFDWLPYLTNVGVRLARHWPGPLTLLASQGVKEGLARWLPAEVRRALCPDGMLAVTVPNQPLIRRVAHHLALPLVLATPPGNAKAAEDLEALGGLALVLDGGTLLDPRRPTVVRLDGRTARVEREGTISATDVQKSLPCRIVFVCTGNTCRSPMAKALCEKLLADRVGCSVVELAGRGYVVESAGIAALPGDAASPDGVEAIRPFGGDLSKHRSQPLSYELLAEADFVFAMTRSHLYMLRELQQNVGPTPRLLSLAGEDVSDPIGGAPEVYEACARQILAHLEQILPELLAA